MMRYSLKISKLLLLLCLSLGLGACSDLSSSNFPTGEIENGSWSGPTVSEKVDGVALVAPPNPFVQKNLEPVVQANAGWIQIIPYGFSYAGKAEVFYDSPNQWWGERTEGVRKSVEYSKALGLKVLIKPHVWVIGQGWAGDYSLATEEEWEIWEEDYRAYILAFAELGQELDADMICIGTEYKKAVAARPEFWADLADEVRTIFDGEVTYAANWDNYENVTFWDHLDYVGIDAYFPLVDAKVPGVQALQKAWRPYCRNFENFAEKTGKPILFTEFGYLSVEKAGWQNWELEGNLHAQPLSMEAQKNCYEAFFESLWEQPWFAGGFLWHWYVNNEAAGGTQNPDYTPQNKPSLEIVSEYYE